MSPRIFDRPMEDVVAKQKEQNAFLDVNAEPLLSG